MELFEIIEPMKAVPGEYVYHDPTRQIVICGAFNRADNTIKALARGAMLVDKIENFKKIKLTPEERRVHKAKTGCKGCRQ